MTLRQQLLDDGQYWIQDPHRYGWEVVRVMAGQVFRFGMSEPDRDDWVLDLECFRVDPPTS